LKQTKRENGKVTMTMSQLTAMRNQPHSPTPISTGADPTAATAAAAAAEAADAAAAAAEDEPER
jgi:hypothetical protein